MNIVIHISRRWKPWTSGCHARALESDARRPDSPSTSHTDSPLAGSTSVQSAKSGGCVALRAVARAHREHGDEALARARPMPTDDEMSIEGLTEDASKAFEKALAEGRARVPPRPSSSTRWSFLRVRRVRGDPARSRRWPTSGSRDRITPLPQSYTYLDAPRESVTKAHHHR